MIVKGRERRVALENYLRKVADWTDPDEGLIEANQRQQCRIRCNFPAFVVPWQPVGPVRSQCVFGVTQNVSEQGAAILLTQPCPRGTVAVGLWPTSDLLTATSSHPGFLIGEVRQEAEIGGGFTRIGVLFRELLDPSHPAFETLRDQALHLLPPDQRPSIAGSSPAD